MANVTITPSAVVPPALNSTAHNTPATIIAGEAIAAGEIVCLLASDGKYYLADANVLLKTAVIGMAGNSAAAAGQRLDVITRSPGVVIGTHGVAVGTPLFLSMTPGKLCPLADLSTGAYPILMGYTASSTAMQIDISASTVPIP